jgi:hypothetical protein
LSKTDGKVLQVKIVNSNAAEFKGGKAPLLTMNHASRSVARLAKENEVSLMQDLDFASCEVAQLENWSGDVESGPPLNPDVRVKITAYLNGSQAWTGQCTFPTEHGSVCNI